MRAAMQVTVGVGRSIGDAVTTDGFLRDEVTPYDAYRQLLTRWNRAIRLVGDDADFDRHVAESRVLLPFLPEVGRLVDVGAGGGFPAVVIAIERPGVHVVALEPIHKKHAFLAAAQRELGL